ncbi:TonB-dependent receptor [Gayadomonas joobiniege]|uniref:TonB-dependent receptor n=1 Tax=Gayadomonas joobiniege TaxID=1234606 RepID=UPI00037B8FFD|nr:TonB-dependent receptor [Gayadomonas joobiniege]
MKQFTLSKLCLVLPFMSTSHVFANIEDKIEVIHVQGDFRQQNLQTASVSLSVLDAEALTRTSQNHLEDAIMGTANVNFSGATSRARFFQIRGLGASGEFDVPVNYPVGLYLDDIDFTHLGSASTLFDIEQVEVFRGPQGTRFGANALAGLIYLKSAQPTDMASAKVKAGIANYDTYELGAAYGNAINGSARYRVSAHQYLSDGFIKNDYLNRDDTNNRDELTLRGHLTVDLSDSGQLDLTYHHINVDNGYDTFSLDNTRTTLSDEPGKDTQNSNAFGAVLSQKVNSHVSLKAIASYADTNSLYQYDEDWAYTDIAEGSYSAVDSYQHDRNNASFEFRLVSEKKILQKTTDWVAGLYWQNKNDEMTRSYTYLTADLVSDFENQKRAIFAQTDSELGDGFSLTAGLRYETHQLDYQNSEAIRVAEDYNMLGGKLVLGYQINNALYAYSAISRGYMSGGINRSGSLNPEQRSFAPEYLWNYEAGLKYRADNLAIRGTLFYMDREDVQLKRDFLFSREDGSTEFISYTRNGSDGYSQGAELELDWYVQNWLQVYANLGLLRAEYEAYEDPLSGEYYAARELSQSPTYTYQVGTNITINSDLWFNLTLNGRDQHYFSDDDLPAEAAVELPRSKEVALLNAALNYQMDEWLVKLWARNLADRDYYAHGFYFGNDPRDNYSDKAYYQYGEPARFGISFEYEY